MCTKCRLEKPIDDFHKHHREKDGHRSTCKKCEYEYEKERRLKNPQVQERKNELNRYRYRTNSELRKKMNQQSKEYMEKHPGYKTKINNDYRKRYPEKNTARASVQLALKYKKIVRPDTCEKCGETGRIEGHHADYSKPLDVQWLCQKCHKAEHMKITIQKERENIRPGRVRCIFGGRK